VIFVFLVTSAWKLTDVVEVCWYLRQDSLKLFLVHVVVEEMTRDQFKILVWHQEERKRLALERSVPP
jgi:hypothetical protein